MGSFFLIAAEPASTSRAYSFGSDLGREVMEVGLVPELPPGDRQPGQVRVGLGRLCPEVAVSAVAVGRGGDEAAPVVQLALVLHRQVGRALADPGRGRVEGRHDPDTFPGRRIDGGVKPGPVELVSRVRLDRFPGDRDPQVLDLALLHAGRVFSGDPLLGHDPEEPAGRLRHGLGTRCGQAQQCRGQADEQGRAEPAPDGTSRFQEFRLVQSGKWHVLFKQGRAAVVAVVLRDPAPVTAPAPFDAATGRPAAHARWRPSSAAPVRPVAAPGPSAARGGSRRRSGGRFRRSPLRPASPAAR